MLFDESIINSNASTAASSKDLSPFTKDILRFPPFYPYYEVFNQFPIKHLLHSRLRVGANVQNFYNINPVPIGQGLSGPVHLVTHKKMNCVYAMKTLQRAYMNITDTQLCNEVLIFLKLDHPNIVKLCEVFIEDDSIHLIMEYCIGSDLFKKLIFMGHLPESMARNITLQMLSAISYCHSLHICHRDVKLENWVFTGYQEDSQIKMIDFGLSCVFIPGNPMRSMRGTVDYVSPEMMDGAYSESCDLWSIGIIVYSILSGLNPFKGKADTHTLLNIKTQPLLFPSHLWEHTSGDAQDFVAGLLKKNVSERMTLQQAFHHPWITPLEKFFWGDVDKNIFEQIQKFADLSVIKKAALGVIALYYPPIEQIHYLENQFRKLDTQGHGVIDVSMLSNILCEKLSISQENATSISKKVDLLGDSSIQLWEFITATLQFEASSSKEMFLDFVFERFDGDGKGHISLENLRGVLGNSYGGILVEEILNISDLKKNGVIEFDEFLDAFEKLDLEP